MRGAARLLPRLLPVVVVLAVALAAAPAAGQSTPTATARLEVADPGPADGTALVPFRVTLAVAGFPCLQDATFTVPLSAASDRPLAATVHPESLAFTVPAGQSLAGFSQSRDAVVAVGPAPPGTNTTVAVTAGAPEGGCPDAPPTASAERAGDEAEVTVLWSTVPPSAPEQAIPGAPLGAVLAAFWAIGQGSRRMLLNSPRP